MVFHAHPGPKGGVYLIKVYHKDLYWKYVQSSRRVQLATVDETEGSASLVFKWHIIPNSSSTAFTIRPAYALGFALDKHGDHPTANNKSESDRLDWRIWKRDNSGYSTIKYDDDNNDDVIGCSTADSLLKFEYPNDSEPNQRFVFQFAVARYSQFFGYGSNIGDEQMKERCPDHLYSCITRLEDWKWIINSRHYRTISRLDNEEGSRYVKSPVAVHLDGVVRNPGAVLTYIDHNTTPGHPGSEYVKRLRKAMRDGIAKDVPPQYFNRYWLPFLQPENPAVEAELEESE